jgi:prophage regulatory protein
LTQDFGCSAGSRDRVSETQTASPGAFLFGLLGAHEEKIIVTTTPAKTIAAAKSTARKTKTSASPRLLSRRELLAKVPVSYPTIWKWMREGTFPRSRDIGGKVAWIESEIDAWIANLNIVPLKGDAAA